MQREIATCLAADELGLAAESGEAMLRHLNAAVDHLQGHERNAAVLIRVDLTEALRRLRPLRIFVGDNA